MIQPNEIRIGVIVTVDNPKHHPKLKDVPLKVIGVEEKVIEGAITHSVRLEHINQKVNMFYETYSQFIKFIYPIPLTEDVLLKCGFEKYIEDGYTYYKKSDFFHLKVFNESGDISYECGDNLKGNYIHFRVDYLHTLQNLYFALTNQELEIEL